MSELRLLTYNVRSLRDDIGAVAAVVRSARPDVVAVQEAPRFLRWRSKRAALARHCGLLVATADRDGGLFLMTSLRAQVVSTSYSRLPKTSGLHQRAISSAVFDLGGAHWRVASVHFSVSAEERQSHLPFLLAVLQLAPEPLIIAGDINEDPDGPVFSQLAEQYQDVAATAGAARPTSPAISAHRRLDAVFADRRIEVVSCEVLDGPDVERGSDHRPVLAVLRQ